MATEHLNPLLPTQGDGQRRLVEKILLTLQGGGGGGGGGSTSGVSFGSGNPTTPPATTYGLYVDVDTGSIWYYNGGWIQKIA